MLNNKIIWTLAILGVILGGWALVGGDNQPVPEPRVVGGVTNYDSLTLGEDLIVGGTITATGETNVSNLISGGASFATSTDAAGTFTAAQVCDNNLIVATPNVGAVTLTFPTSALLFADCLPTIGDEKTIRVQNATTTTGANSIITFADGANGDHQEQEGATTVIEGTEWAEITFLNIDGTNHMMLVTVTQVGD
jgi:hypothetical protein